MKILNLEKNDFGQIVATVVNCGKEIRIFADKFDQLPKAIVKACKFVTYEDVKMDLELNYQSDCREFFSTVEREGVVRRTDENPYAT